MALHGLPGVGLGHRELVGVEETLDDPPRLGLEDCLGLSLRAHQKTPA